MLNWNYVDYLLMYLKYLIWSNLISSFFLQWMKHWEGRPQWVLFTSVQTSSHTNEFGVFLSAGLLALEHRSRIEPGRVLENLVGEVQGQSWKQTPSWTLVRIRRRDRPKYRLPGETPPVCSKHHSDYIATVPPSTSVSRGDLSSLCS